MTNTVPADWSPADNSHAIAVSEAQWWLRAARLAILRIHDDEDRRAGFSSRQIDARFVVFALRQLLAAECLEQVALKALGIASPVSDALAQTRQRFEGQLPGIKDMRDALMHFDEWSRGEGRGPQKERRQAGEALRDVAADYWGFAYDPERDTISLGPYTIHVGTADRAAHELCRAIDRASREVDTRHTRDLRARTVHALTSAGIRCDEPDVALKVSRGEDLRVWLSLDIGGGPDEHERRELSARVVTALATAGLRLTCPAEPQNENAAELLTHGASLNVESDPAAAGAPPD